MKKNQIKPDTSLKPTDNLTKPGFPPEDQDITYDLAENFEKFTKKQQQALLLWLQDPNIRSVRQLAVTLKQDHTTLCNFLFHNEKTKQFLRQWALQTIPDRIHNVDLNLYRSAMVPNNLDAIELFYKRFALIQKDTNIQVNNIEQQQNLQVNIVPVKPKEHE